MTMRHFGYQDKILLLQHGSTELLSLAQRRGALLHKLLSGTGIFEQDLHKPLENQHNEDCRRQHSDLYWICQEFKDFNLCKSQGGCH